MTLYVMTLSPLGKIQRKRMNILFISISSLPHVMQHGISLDLIHEFKRQGHEVYIICALERKDNRETYITEESGCRILRVKIGNNKKTNTIEKGITTVLLPKQYIAAIKKYYSDVKFELLLYPTPPVTQIDTVKYVKKRDGAVSYLLLKDIFPQNAVDIGMISKSGVKGILYKYFRQKEKKLYAISDYIGCMSQANIDYVLKHNPEINPETVEVCPNSVEIVNMRVNSATRDEMRQKYGIPLDKKVFVYGGNLGKPQGIPFLIKCLEAQMKNQDVYFLIVGDGTEFGKLEQFFNEQEPENMKLMKRLPKEDYDQVVAACDVGIIFLDHRFTIPNFPSRLLSYMQAGIPVLACTDQNTDIGKVIVGGGFGWWCESNDVKVFLEKVREACNSNLESMGKSGFKYLEENYNVKNSYEIIMKHFT